MVRVMLFWGMIILLVAILADAYFIHKAKHPRANSKRLEVIAILLLILAINAYFFPTKGIIPIIAKLLVN